MDDFSHLQMISYNVQIGDKVTHKVGIFNCNKLPTGVAIQCIETDTYNPYLLTMTQEHFNALFLDDKPQDTVTADSDNTSNEVNGL